MLASETAVISGIADALAVEGVEEELVDEPAGRRAGVAAALGGSSQSENHRNEFPRSKITLGISKNAVAVLSIIQNGIELKLRTLRRR